MSPPPLKPVPPMAQKILSGLIVGWFASLAFGFIIGILTFFIAAIPGALLGWALGFWWGYANVGDGLGTNSPNAASAPRSIGDIAFLVTSGFANIWLVIAVSNLFFGYKGPYRGSHLGLLLPLLGMVLAPFVALKIERVARRKIPLPTRDYVGIAFLFFFLLTVALWWRWAEARDQAAAAPTKHFARHSII